MSLRGLAVLALLLAAGLAWVLLADRPEPEDAAPEKAPLLPASPAEPARIELRSPAGSVVLERAGTEWRVAEPQAGPADPRTVRNLLRSLADARVEKVVAEKGADLAPYGLASPEAQVTLSPEGGPPVTLALGGVSPVAFQRYAATGDGRVLLVDGALYGTLSQDPGHFVEKRLFPVEPEEIRRVEIDRPGGRLVLEREGDGWALREPVADRADYGAAQALARRLAGMTLAPGGGEPGPDPILVAVDGRRAVVGAQGEDLPRPARGPAASGLLPAEDARELERPASDFRDRALATFSSPDVREVEISGEGTPLVVSRAAEGGPWRAREGTGEPVTADAAKVEAMLDRVRLRAAGFPADASFTPRRTVAVRGEGGTELARLEIGEGSRVRVPGRPGLVFEAAPETLEKIPSKAADLAP